VQVIDRWWGGLRARWLTPFLHDWAILARVVEEEDKIVGFPSVSSPAAPVRTVGSGYIHLVGIHPDFRAEGLRASSTRLSSELCVIRRDASQGHHQLRQRRIAAVSTLRSAGQRGDSELGGIGSRSHRFTKGFELNASSPGGGRPKVNGGDRTGNEPMSPLSTPEAEHLPLSLGELGNIGLFGGPLGTRYSRTSWPACARRPRAPGHTNLREGDDAREMYVILAGEIEVLKRSKRGTEARVALLEGGLVW